MSGEPHTLDCPCDACDRLREISENLTELLYAGSHTAEELAERWLKVGQAQ